MVPCYNSNTQKAELTEFERVRLYRETLSQKKKLSIGEVQKNVSKHFSRIIQ
jgi:hypothetical protein